MPDADDLRDALAEQLDAIPVDRWPTFLVELRALFQRRQDHDDLETLRRSFATLIADSQRTRH